MFETFVTIVRMALAAVTTNLKLRQTQWRPKKRNLILLKSLFFSTQNLKLTTKQTWKIERFKICIFKFYMKSAKTK